MRIRKLQWLAVYAALAIMLSSCNLGSTPAPTQDLGVIQTEAFNEVLTQVALASSPTPLPSTPTQTSTPTLQVPPTFAVVGGGGAQSTVTPFDFNSPLPSVTPLSLLSVPTLPGAVSTVTTKNGCNDGLLLSEGPPYDGAYLNPGEAFEKTWSFTNVGTCAWDEGYTFAFLPTFSSEGFAGYDIKFEKAEDFTAPGAGISFIVKLKASTVAGEHLGVWKLRDDSGNYFGSMVWVKYMINTK